MIKVKRFNQDSEMGKLLDDYLEFFQKDLNNMIDKYINFVEDYIEKNNFKLNSLEVYSVFILFLQFATNELKEEFDIKKVEIKDI